VDAVRHGWFSHDDAVAILEGGLAREEGEALSLVLPERPELILDENGQCRPVGAWSKKRNSGGDRHTFSATSSTGILNPRFLS